MNPKSPDIPSNLTSESIVQRTQDLVATAMDRELVMMHVENGRYFGLDPIGSDIWGRLEAPTSVADLCTDLQANYKVEAPTCERDVIALLQDMIREGLVRLAE